MTIPLEIVDGKHFITKSENIFFSNFQRFFDVFILHRRREQNILFHQLILVIEPILARDNFPIILFLYEDKSKLPIDMTSQIIK